MPLVIPGVSSYRSTVLAGIDRPRSTLARVPVMRITSPAFAHEGVIPKRYTCDGNDVSPPLSWTGAPEGTRSFALIVDDPDAPDPAAPKRVWVHWVVYNIPASVTALAEGVDAAALDPRIRVGWNDSNEQGYGGPCPPIGRHRYFHKLFALDAELPDLGPQARKVDVERAMAGHLLASAELLGTYQR